MQSTGGNFIQERSINLIIAASITTMGFLFLNIPIIISVTAKHLSALLKQCKHARVFMTQQGCTYLLLVSG